MKFELSQRIFEKYSNIKFHDNPFRGSRVVPYGRTDGHDEANSRFSQFCEGAKKKKQTKAIPLQSTSKCNVANMCILHGDKLCFFVFNNIFKHIML